MTDFTASNGFTVTEYESGAIKVDNLVFGVESAKAIMEYLLSKIPAAEYEVHLPAWSFQVSLDELDADEATFVWGNFDPAETDILLTIPAGIWKELGRPSGLTLDFHEEV